MVGPGLIVVFLERPCQLRLRNLPALVTCHNLVLYCALVVHDTRLLPVLHAPQPILPCTSAPDGQDELKRQVNAHLQLLARATTFFEINRSTNIRK